MQLERELSVPKSTDASPPRSGSTPSAVAGLVTGLHRHGRMGEGGVELAGLQLSLGTVFMYVILRRAIVFDSARVFEDL